MKRLAARFRQLSAGERRLFCRAVLYVVLIRLGLSLLPFRWIRRGVDHFQAGAGDRRKLDAGQIRQVVWAVEAASRRIPHATCLTRGMATQLLLGRLGQPSELRLGVLRRGDGGIGAHAWVEADGRVIIGSATEGFERYTPLRHLEPTEGRVEGRHLKTV